MLMLSQMKSIPTAAAADLSSAGITNAVAEATRTRKMTWILTKCMILCRQVRGVFSTKGGTERGSMLIRAGGINGNHAVC